jgi:histidyl-tRNA synthetase
LQLGTPRGVRDFGPSEAISLKYMTGVIEEIFKRFGFSPLDTPAIENLSILDAKAAYSDEQNKEIFKLDGEEAGLRYDLTVPLARYVASNRDIVLPFKRYQIANSWRKDEPQRLRYREFVQADVDVIGSAEPDSDAEVIAATLLAIEELGITEYALLINSRQLLQNLLEFFKVPKDKETGAIRILDKLQKIGREGVLKQLKELGVDSKAVQSLLEFVEKEGDNETKLERLRTGVSGTEGEASKMDELLGLLKPYGFRGRIAVDFSLARGFDYYTGFVWEVVMEEDGKRLPTIVSGGRYDKLIGTYSDRSIPAVGSSIGLSRIFDLIGGKTATKTSALVFVAFVGDNKAYAASVANALRAQGIYTDLNYTKRNLSKQLEYAGALGMRYAAIVGDKERAASKINLRDMLKGSEEMLTVQEATERLKLENLE